MTKALLTKYWPLLTISALSILTVWPLFLPGYFSHHDELQVMRIFEMRRCLEDLQIPCRWVPDMGFGNGFPLFNYYGVFPYYLGALISFPVGFIGAAKVLFFIPLVLGGFSMYLLAKELFGLLPGLTAAILYLLAPYRALDAYIRGAVAESFAIATIPLVFYFVLKQIRQKSGANFLGTTLSLAAFLTTHNITVLFFVPILLLWIIYWLTKENFQHLWQVFWSVVLGFGLAAFFLLPAFWETSLVQTENLTRFDLDFRAHFVTIRQLFFSRFWGYGASVLGSSDTISFQIGWPHWWLVLATLAGLLINRLKQYRTIIIILLTIFVLSLFMTHNKSAYLWEKIGILRFAQFPWRFLAVGIFSASLLGGLTVIMFERIWQCRVMVVVIALTVVFNWQFFRPEKFYYFRTDQEELSGILWETQQKAGILDYLPKTASEPREPAPKTPVVRSGEEEVKNFDNKSNKWTFQVVVKQQANIEVPVFDFPNWQVKVNGLTFPHSHKNLLGRISLDLPPGSYSIEGKLTNTPVRTLANLISLISLIILVSLSFYGKIKRSF